MVNLSELTSVQFGEILILGPDGIVTTHGTSDQGLWGLSTSIFCGKTIEEAETFLQENKDYFVVKLHGKGEEQC